MSLWTILALSPLVWSTLALSSSCLPTQTLVTLDGNEYCVDPSAIVDNTDAANGVACGFAAVSGSIGYSCTYSTSSNTPYSYFWPSSVTNLQLSVVGQPGGSSISHTIYNGEDYAYSHGDGGMGASLSGSLTVSSDDIQEVAEGEIFVGAFGGQPGLMTQLDDEPVSPSPGGGFSSFGLPSGGTVESIQASRLVVAGGGGGGGDTGYARAWDGGNAGLPGSSAETANLGKSVPVGGGGATQHGPGLGGSQGANGAPATTNGQDGSGFTGGDGASSTTALSFGAAGGGGGGYYGGGGGAFYADASYLPKTINKRLCSYDIYGGGGGGGSSYLPDDLMDTWSSSLSNSPASVTVSYGLPTSRFTVLRLAPTQAAQRRRAYKRRKMQEYFKANPACPHTQRACPLPSGNFECIDFDELTSCGGCVGSGTGVDCLALPGVNGVSCIENKCLSSSCLTGFVLHRGQCIPEKFLERRC